MIVILYVCIFVETKPKNMTTQIFTIQASNELTGKKIIEAKNNYIKLEDGFYIYLDDSEIEHINSVESKKN